MRALQYRLLSPRGFIWFGLLFILAVQATPLVAYGPSLGAAEPGRTTVFERAVQLYIVATGPFRVEGLPPRAFVDRADPTRSLPPSLLEWRIAGTGMT